MFLLPETGSPFVEERIMALSRITKLVCCITSHCTPKGMKDFKMGKLAGHLALCSKDSSESVCHWAADALHCLYTLILHQKSMMKPENDTEFMELMQDWKEEKIFWLAWFSDISTTTMKFKKCLHADEQMDFLLAAIKGMRDDNLYHTKAAILMMKAMLRDPQPVFIKVRCLGASCSPFSSLPGHLFPPLSPRRCPKPPGSCISVWSTSETHRPAWKSSGTSYFWGRTALRMW
ncbi:uncharacterized protein LOC117046353 [Lacerta agilis]|uniref:uncharacterized protein LOC117046353 n=1 Tax=Lacerta agilis TaxID=80427 RepID=UPI00141A31BE|nr:uncharacterized protein LOC117046353 [Lacerta agilis]